MGSVGQKKESEIESFEYETVGNRSVKGILNWARRSFEFNVDPVVDSANLLRS